MTLKNRPELTADRLRAVLSYDPQSGQFRRLTTSGGKPVGSIAGSLHYLGYVKIRIDNKFHLAHRLAWLYVHGQWPTAQIDHINGLKADNRIANLREATHSENGQNRPLQKNNTSGVAGVCWDSRNCHWQARIRVSNKVINLGTFADFSDAVAARLAAKPKFHKFHPVERGVAATESLKRLSECRELCISGDPHTEQSLAQYNAERAREYVRADARRTPHPQQPMPGVR